MNVGRFLLTLGLITLILTACDVGTDGRSTPTIRPTDTLSLTEIADLWTDTPTQTASATSTRTMTTTASPTFTPSATLTGTATQTATATITASSTVTSTNTPSPTATHTSTFTATELPTETPLPPSATRSLTNSPEPVVVTEAFTDTPTATFTPTASNTPRPTFTPRQRTSTAAATNLVTIPANTATSLPTATVVGFASPTFIPAPNTPTPLVFDSSAGGNGNTTGVVPQSNAVVVQDLSGVIRNSSGTELATGRAFDVGPQGQLAVQGLDGQLYTPNGKLGISPASEFGLREGANVGYIDWSPAGGSIAFTFRYPDEGNVDNGVWVYNTYNNTSQQIYRDIWDRRAERVSFSPDSSVVLIRVMTPDGSTANFFLPATWQANQGVPVTHYYADATWGLGGTSIIVSGPRTGGGESVLGRVLLDNDQTFVPYNFASAGVSYTSAATELSDGRIAFLGSNSATGPFQLYLMTVGGFPIAVSSQITGRILSWEWNASHTALLLLMDNVGVHQLWVVSTNGTLQNVTPPIGAPATARW